MPEGEFDGVLVDAPCSGSGALCREPDARWRIDDAAVARFQETQGEVLRIGAGLVRPGGALVFATCSIFQEEGEGVVGPFLAANPGFRLAAEERRWPHRKPAQASTWRGSSGVAPKGRTRLTGHRAAR